MQTVVIKISQEQANYLQRLGLEIDTKVFLIERMIDMHKDDTSFSESPAFQYYIQEYEKAYAEYELAKEEFQNDYVKVEINRLFGNGAKVLKWNIDDFRSLECKVLINND